MRAASPMMRRLPAGLVTVLLAAFCAAGHAEGAPVTANLSKGKEIFEKGKGGSVPPCASCHGEKGLGVDTMGTPRLANIGYAYVVKQLTNFAEGQRQDLTQGVMPIFAQQLTPEDRRDVAAFVNTLPFEKEESNLADLKASGTDVGEPYKGEVLVKYGVLGKVPACQSCHGYNGRGADPIFPMIGQQKYVYLTNQLKHWRDASRANDPLGAMRAVAKNLTDEDINNAAAFLSRAPQSVLGDSFLPDNQTVLKNIVLIK
jgi:cytochrome c553